MVRRESDIKISNGEGYFKFEIEKDIRESGTIKVEVNEVGEESASKLQTVTVLQETKIIVELIPESGFIVGGVPNRIYFNATDMNGESTEFEGKLFALSDQDSPIIDQIKTLHRGKGKFEFIPKVEESYFIRVYFRNGERQEIMLPRCDASKNIILNTNHCVFQNPPYNIKYSPVFEIRIYNSSGNRMEDLNIEVRIKENIIYSRRIDLEKGENILRPIDIVDLNMQTGGIGILSLMSPKERGKEPEILGERLIYIHPQNTLKIDVKYNKEDKKYSPGDKVKLFLSALPLPQTNQDFIPLCPKTHKMLFGSDHYAHLATPAICDNCNCELHQTSNWHTCKTCEYDLCLSCGEAQEILYIYIYISDIGKLFQNVLKDMKCSWVQIIMHH